MIKSPFSFLHIYAVVRFFFLSLTDADFFEVSDSRLTGRIRLIHSGRCIMRETSLSASPLVLQRDRQARSSSEAVALRQALGDNADVFVHLDLNSISPVVSVVNDLVVGLL